MRKLTLKARSMFAMAAIAISTSAVSSAQYNFRNLFVPGATQTNVYGISNNNTITGSYTTASGTYGFTYNPSTNAWHYPINDPKGADTNAYSSNTDGTVVGAYFTPPGGYNGMVEEAGTFTDLLPSGCTESVVVAAINDAGTMGGHCENTNSDNELQTVAWEGYPTNVTFSCFNSTFTVASAVNNWLLMVGSFSQDNGMVTTGFISTDQGTCTAVNYPNAANTILTGINDFGTIAGSYWPSQDGPPHGFLITGSKYTTVDVPGAKATLLGQVNNNNWLVGGYVIGEKSYSFFAIPTTAPSTLADWDNRTPPVGRL